MIRMTTVVDFHSLPRFAMDFFKLVNSDSQSEIKESFGVENQVQKVPAKGNKKNLTNQVFFLPVQLEYFGVAGFVVMCAVLFSQRR